MNHCGARLLIEHLRFEFGELVAVECHQSALVWNGERESLLLEQFEQGRYQDFEANRYTNLNVPLIKNILQRHTYSEHSGPYFVWQ